MKFFVHLLDNIIFTSFVDNLNTYFVNLWMACEILLRLFPKLLRVFAIFIHFAF
jgi:hypothetical protein